MARTGKSDRTGRSSGKIAGKKLREWGLPPPGVPWVWLTRDLLESDAWRGQSIHCRKLIDFLLLDRMAHAGTENEALMATYDQLVDFGISRKKISSAIREAEKRGLIRAEHGGRWNMTNRPSLFRLTFYTFNSGAPASNEWKRYRKPEKQNPGIETGTTVVPHAGTTGHGLAESPEPKSAEIRQLPKCTVVPHVGTASISSQVRNNSKDVADHDNTANQGGKNGVPVDLRVAGERGFA